MATPSKQKFLFNCYLSNKYLTYYWWLVMKKSTPNIIVSKPSRWIEEKYEKHQGNVVFPEIIYKFRDLNNFFHRDTLFKQELYFSAPSDFNDPFDCKITRRYELLNTPEQREQFMNTMLIENFNMWSNHIEKVMRVMDDKLTDLEKLQQEYEPLIFEEHDKWYGVLCFSSYWNNILMWSHYAQCHKGICIGFHEKKLREIVGESSGGMVNYDSEIPAIDPLEDDAVKEMFLTTQPKAVAWKYESEYRITKLYWQDQESIQINRVAKYPIEVIAEIFLGLSISEVQKVEVVRFCTENNIPLYQVQKVKNKFELTCYLVQ